MSLTDWKTILSKIGDLTALTTTAKGNLVSAINELKNALPVSGSTSSFLPKIIDLKPPILNTALEIELCSLTIPANIPLGTIVKFVVWGKIANQSTAAANFKFRIKHDSPIGSVMLESGNTSFPAMAANTGRKFKFEGAFFRANPNNRIYSELCIAAVSTEIPLSMPVTTGNAYFFSTFFPLDFSQPTNLIFTSQVSPGSPSISVQLEGAIFS
jgi:hypothetical protein